MNSEIKLQFKSYPRLLASVRALMRAYLREYGFEETRIHEIVLAVDEACANVVRHAHRNKPETLATVLLRRTDALLEIIVIDQGPPMPPDALRPFAAPALDVATVRPGGLGLKLMNAIFDEVRITAGKRGGNRVHMRLHLE